MDVVPRSSRLLGPLGEKKRRMGKESVIRRLKDDNHAKRQHRTGDLDEIVRNGWLDDTTISNVMNPEEIANLVRNQRKRTLPPCAADDDALPKPENRGAGDAGLAAMGVSTTKRVRMDLFMPEVKFGSANPEWSKRYGHMDIADAAPVSKIPTLELGNIVPVGLLRQDDPPQRVVAAKLSDSGEVEYTVVNMDAYFRPMAVMRNPVGTFFSKGFADDKELISFTRNVKNPDGSKVTTREDFICYLYSELRSAGIGMPWKSKQELLNHPQIWLSIDTISKISEDYGLPDTDDLWTDVLARLETAANVLKDLEQLRSQTTELVERKLIECQEPDAFAARACGEAFRDMGQALQRAFLAYLGLRRGKNYGSWEKAIRFSDNLRAPILRLSEEGTVDVVSGAKIPDVGALNGLPDSSQQETFDNPDGRYPVHHLEDVKRFDELMGSKEDDKGSSPC